MIRSTALKICVGGIAGMLVCGSSHAAEIQADQKTMIMESTLEIMDVATGKRRTVYRAQEHFEAPNWTPDGKLLVYNMDGKIYSIPVEGGTPSQIDTGPAIRCNNDHGITPDGKTLIISDSHEGNGSVIYTLPLAGGIPTRLTNQAQSYWHGVSPNGQMLTYCARRNGQYDIHTIPIQGGEETQLTDEPGLDDGPEFSPDGKYIYFNSTRSGMMNIWRMKADGSDPTQMTFGTEYNDWFAHPSPDNQWLVFVSYNNQIEPGHHPPNKDVCLRMMPAEGGEPKTVAKLFGGQGTLNAPSWSPDSRKFAFVSYKLIDPTQN